jgi:hypothetical protein
LWGLSVNTKKLFVARVDVQLQCLYTTSGSLVSRIYTKKDLKSSPGQIFALIAEASKWSIVLKDVIEKCGLLAEERKV